MPRNSCDRPVTARQLIEDMTKAADLPIEIIEHQRLTPIQVAPKAWNLRQLPPDTILVAFRVGVFWHSKPNWNAMAEKFQWCMVRFLQKSDEDNLNALPKVIPKYVLRRMPSEWG
ncbi:MAG UNVERIFIED_CONTAM: hypothetical protein LVT10_12885 [Anaerolineae bacterium]|jgi:hypothetical protein